MRTLNEKWKNSRRFHFTVTLIAIILAVILCIDFSITRKAEEAETTKTVKTVTEKEKKDKVLISVSTDTIKDGLANMGVLITQEYYFTQIEKYTKEKKIFIVIPSMSEFMYSYDGSVMAGVDFGKINIKTDEDRNTVVVEMPPSEIQTVTIDKDTFRIYSEKESLWNPLKLEDYNVSLIEFEDAAKEKALASGILERSDQQAEKLVREFIGSLPNAAGYNIEVVQSLPSLQPASLPAGDS